MHKWIFIVNVLVTGLLLGSCYEKDARKENGPLRVVVDDKPLSAEDSLLFMDTFNLVDLNQVVATLEASVRKLHVLELPDELEREALFLYEDTLAQLAIATVYLEWGEVTNQTELRDSSWVRLEALATAFFQDSLVHDVVADSLLWYTQTHVLLDSTNTNLAYFEAVQWLEMTHLILNKKWKVKNKKRYHQLLVDHFNHGEELLHRLYLYQSYEPISRFTDGLIALLENDLDQTSISQLRERVFELRSTVFQFNQNAEDTRSGSDH